MSTFAALVFVETSSFAQPVAPPFSPPLPPQLAPPIAPPLPPQLAPPLAPPLSSGDQLPPLGPLPPGLVPPRAVPPPPVPSSRPWLETPPVVEFPKSDWDFLFSLQGNVAKFSFATINAAEASASGDAAATLTRFLSPVVDDDAPRTLQPFLQRTSTVFASFDFGGTSASAEASPNRGTPATNRIKLIEPHGGPAIGADVYVIPEFALTGGLAYDYDPITEAAAGQGGQFETTVHIHRVTPHAGVAARFGDTRIDLSYALELDAVANGDSPGQLWGTISLDAITVIAKEVELRLGGQVFDAGAGASTQIDVFPTKDVDLFGGFFGYAGRKFIDNHVSHNDYGGFVGMGYWLVPRARLVAQYQLAGTTIPGDQPQSNGGYSEIQNELTLSLLARLP
jgi:hypothetical protein